MPRKLSPAGQTPATTEDELRKIARENLIRELKARNMNMRALSRAAGLADTYARDFLERQRGGSRDGIARMAAVFDQSYEQITSRYTTEPKRRSNWTFDNTQAERASALPEAKRHEPSPARPIRVVGEVAASVWTEVEALSQMNEDDLPVSHLPADPRWPSDAQYDLLVKGTSMNRVARDGDFVRCVDVERASIALRDGDLVIVRRLRGGMVETTCKRARRFGNKVEYWPDSSDPRYQEPLSVEAAEAGTTVEIIGLVLYTYAPTASSHRGGGIPTGSPSVKRWDASQ